MMFLFIDMYACVSVCYFRQAKLEQRSAATKVEEMTRLLQSVQDQMQRKVRDVAIIVLM